MVAKHVTTIHLVMLTEQLAAVLLTYSSTVHRQLTAAVLPVKALLVQVVLARWVQVVVADQ
jgi:hypothetical protein